MSEQLLNGKILKVLCKDNQTPTGLHRWNRDIKYYRSMITEGYQAIMFYENGNKMTRTSYVEKVEEDNNNLIVTTENSIYYIKKVID